MLAWLSKFKKVPLLVLGQLYSKGPKSQPGSEFWPCPSPDGRSRSEAKIYFRVNKNADFTPTNAQITKNSVI